MAAQHDPEDGPDEGVDDAADAGPDETSDEVSSDVTDADADVTPPDHRRTIQQATGVVMNRYRIDAAEAATLLRQWALTRHLSIVEMATVVVGEVRPAGGPRLGLGGGVIPSQRTSS